MPQEQLTEFNGPSHEQNSLGGIPVGPAATVEGNETLQSGADYVYSDRNVLDKETAAEFRLPSKWVGKTFAAASKLAVPKSGRTDDSIEQQDTARKLDSLREAQEAWKAKELEKDMAMMQEKHPEAMAQMMQSQQAPQQQAPQDPNAMSGMQQGMGQGIEQQMAQGAPQGMPPEMMQAMQQQAPQAMAMGGFVNPGQQPLGPGDPPPRTMPEEYANLQFANGMTWEELTPTQQEAVHYQMNQKQWYDEASGKYKPYPTQSTESKGAGTIQTNLNSYDQYVGYNPGKAKGFKVSTFTNPIIGGMDKEWDKTIRLPAQALKPQIGLGTSDYAMGGFMNNGGPDNPPKQKTIVDPATVGTTLGASANSMQAPGLPVPDDYRANYNKGRSGNTLMPKDAVLTAGALEKWNEKKIGSGFDYPNKKGLPVTGIPQPAQIRGVGLTQPATVPYSYRKGSYYDPYGKPLPREENPASLGIPASNPLSPSKVIKEVEGRGDLTNTFNRPEINFAGGGFVQGLGKGMEQVAGLVSNIPVFGQAIGAGLGGIGAGLQNVGTGADFKEVAKDVGFGAAKGATGSIGNTLIGTAEGLVNNNTLDASEQQAMAQQRALEQGQYNQENPNVAQGGIPVMSNAYGGNIRKPYATGGGINGLGETLNGINSFVNNSNRPMMATDEYPSTYGFNTIGDPRYTETVNELTPYPSSYTVPGQGEQGKYMNPVNPGDAVDSDIANFYASTLNGNVDELPTRSATSIDTGVNSDDYDPIEYDEDGLPILGEDGEPISSKKGSDENDLDFTPTPLELAGRLSPIAYNLAQGLRPSEQLNYEDYRDRSAISRHDPLNMSPYTQGLNEQYQMALKQGRTPAQAQALMNTASKNLGTAYAQKQQFDAQQQQSYEQRVQSQNVNNIQTKAGITDMNQRAEAARRNHLGETFKQVADLSGAGREDKLSMAMLKAVAPDYAGSITVNSYQDMIKAEFEKNQAKRDKRREERKKESYLKGQDKKTKGK